MRQSWTDDRLDDLNGKVDGLSHRVDELGNRVDHLGHRVDELGNRVDDLSRRMDSGFARVDADLRALREETNGRFDSLQRTLLQMAGGTIATLIAGFAGIIATQL